MTDTARALDPAFRGEAPIRGGNLDPTAGGPQWPEQIELSEEAEHRLTHWLSYEIEEFYRERSSAASNWARWQDQYWAEPESEERNFPFKRAANIVVPVTAIAVEAVTARIMNTLFAGEPYFAARARKTRFEPHAKPIERYLQAEVEGSESLDVYGMTHDSILELVKLGTCVGKSGFDIDFKKKNLDGNPIFYGTVNGATLEHVPLNNFMMRLHEKDTQTAGWVGERHRFSWAKLKRMAQTGRMAPEAVESIKAWWVDRQSEGDVGERRPELQKEKNADALPSWSEVFVVDEIWCSFDVDGDGYDEELLLDFHKESRTILSIRYNFYEDMHRPYQLAQYIKVEGIWLGIGVCKQNEQFQEEVTTIHRQRLDNATLANMAQIVVKKNSDYTHGEPIYPGKMWFLDDPFRDINNFKLSEVYPSSYANEESVNRYSEKRSGVNEVILGMPAVGTPGTATGDLQRVEEANKKFTLVLKNIRRWQGKLGHDVLVNLSQFGNGERHREVLSRKDAMLVEEVFRENSTLLREGFIIDLNVSDSIVNRQVEQQQWMTVSQVFQNYYNAAIQQAQVVAQFNQDPTEVLRTMQRAAVAMDYAMRRLAEAMGVNDSDIFALFPELVGIENEDGSTMGSTIGPGGSGTEINGGQQGMESPENAGSPSLEASSFLANLLG